MPKRKSVKRVSKTKRNSLRKTLKRKQLRKNSKRVNRRRKSSRKMRGGAGRGFASSSVVPNLSAGRVESPQPGTPSHGPQPGTPSHGSPEKGFVMVVYQDDKGSYEVIQSTQGDIVNKAIAETTPNRPSLKGVTRRPSTTGSEASDTSGDGPPPLSREGSSSTATEAIQNAMSDKLSEDDQLQIKMLEDIDDGD